MHGKRTSDRRLITRKTADTLQEKFWVVGLVTFGDCARPTTQTKGDLVLST